MPTDPFVRAGLDDLPRQEPNLVPGVHTPPARGWVPDRPGDETAYGQPRGPMLGYPGPNVGYALTLAHDISAEFALAPHEHVEDVLAVVSELAMKRAASYGRAPVIHDLECAALVLGYLGGCDPEVAAQRTAVIEGAHEHYFRRRVICDAVDLDTLRLPAPVLRERAVQVQDQLARAAKGKLSGEGINASSPS